MGRGRPKGSSTRILSKDDRGGSGPRRYRVRYLLDGRKLAEHFATEGKAKAFIREFKRVHAGETGKTVDETIDAWIEDRTKQGLSTRDYYEVSVRQSLADLLDAPAQAATGPALEAGYRKACEGKSGATSRLILACLRIFGAYLVDTRVCKDNPTAGIKARGVAKKGRAQIETRRELLAFHDEAFRRARTGDRASLGVLLGLFLGLRSGEVRRLEARHVDLDRTIRVPGTKTENAARPAKVVSDELWALVEKTARAGGRLVPVDQPYTLVLRVKDIARTAGVANADALVFHSLRGMAASLATAGGAAFDAIAKALGHASYDVTADHYATPASQDAAASTKRLSVLKGGKKG